LNKNNLSYAVLHKTIFEIEVPIGYFNYHAKKNRQAHSTAKIKL